MITKESLCQFGQQICLYVLAYYGIEMTKEKQAEGGLQNIAAGHDLKVPEMSAQLVERVVKVYNPPPQMSSKHCRLGNEVS